MRSAKTIDTHSPPDPSSEPDFAEFLNRIRAGDGEAAAELVRRFEPVIRREVRLAMEDQRLARLFDSVDVSQSVFASFFLRTSNGEYDLQSPQQLAGLLLKMARNKLASRSRDARRTKRDLRRVASAGQQLLMQLESPDLQPSEKFAQQELIESVRAQLSAADWQLLELKVQGNTWAQIACQLGGTAQARRVQLMRGLRAVQSLGNSDGACAL